MTLFRLSEPNKDATLKRAHVVAAEIRYGGKETDRKWEEGRRNPILEFAATEYRRKGKVVATEEVKNDIRNIGINNCARESGFDRKNFIRKLVRDIPVKPNSYTESIYEQGSSTQSSIDLHAPTQEHASAHPSKMVSMRGNGCKIQRLSNQRLSPSGL